MNERFSTYTHLRPAVMPKSDETKPKIKSINHTKQSDLVTWYMELSNECNE